MRIKIYLKSGNVAEVTCSEFNISGTGAISWKSFKDAKDRLVFIDADSVEAIVRAK